MNRQNGGSKTHLCLNSLFEFNFQDFLKFVGFEFVALKLGGNIVGCGWMSWDHWRSMDMFCSWFGLAVLAIDPLRLVPVL